MPDILNRVTVVQKIQNLIEDDAELARILIYLENQGPQNSERWNMLLQLSEMSLNRAFNGYVNELLKEVQKKDQAVPQISPKPTLVSNAVPNAVPIPTKSKTSTALGSVGFSHAWNCVGEEEVAKIFRAFGTVGSVSIAVISRKPWILLPAMFLTYEVMPDLYEWRYGKTSGDCVIGKIIFSSAILAAGIGGAMLFSKLGSYCGPEGALIGRVFGGLYGTFFAAVFALDP